MPWREVLDTPLGVIFQLLGALDMSQGRAMINKRSDKVNNDYAAALTAYNAKQSRKKKKGAHNG